MKFGLGVGNGLVASVARLGGNITGLASMNEDLAGKLAELTREALPMAKQLAMLINPLNSSSRPIFQSLRKAAISIGIAAEAFEANASERIDAAIAASSRIWPDALEAGFDAMLFDQRARIIAIGIAARQPAAAAELASFAASASIGGEMDGSPRCWRIGLQWRCLAWQGCAPHV